MKTLIILIAGVKYSLSIGQNTTTLNPLITKEPVRMDARMFLTDGSLGGYTLTITTRLGDILAKAVDQFGARDNEYTLLGVEFNATSDRPQIWFPRNRKYIAIRLGSTASTNMERALYQLSHEVIHCLAPTGAKNANVLEEGLATYFSEEYMKSVTTNPWSADLPEYQRANNLVRQLLSIDSGIIKRIRLVQPTICMITPQLIIDANPNVPIELAKALCEKF